MAAYEVLLLNTAVPQIQAAQAGDTYVVPRDIAFSTVASFAAGTAAAPSIVATGDVNTGFWFPAADTIAASTGGTERVRLDSSGNLGLGVTPSAWSTTGNLQLKAGSNISAGTGIGLVSNAFFQSGWKYIDSSYATLYGQSGGQHVWYTAPSGTAGNAITFTQALTLDASGNLGLGVTPSAWGSGRKSVDVSNASFYSQSGNYNGVASNAYNNGSNWIYKTTAAAQLYEQGGGLHAWFTAASGTAGNAITFTQAMTLDAIGRLGLGGATSPSSTLDVGGTSGTLLRVGTNSGNGSINFWPVLVGDGTSSGGGTNQNFVRIGRFSDGTAGIDAFQGGVGNAALAFGTFGSERARITSGGDFQTSSGGSVQVGGTAARATTAGTNRVDIFDGTAPVGTLANGVSFYSASGEANVMDAAGNATLLSPHDTETNEWIFRSKHTPTGKVLRIDVERLLRFVNAHFGLDAVKEFVEE
jgi:hypothetical protein